MLSKRHKLIFVHIPKCAGQSIEQLFLEDLGLTWKTRSPLLLRPKLQNEDGPEKLAHLYAYEYVKFDKISRQEFDTYFKFSVVRDPIDRVVSELNYRGIKRGRFGFSSAEEYIQTTLSESERYSDVRRHLEPQISFLFTEDGSSLLVDRVINFDSLDKEISDITTQFCFKKGLRLQHINQPMSQSWLRQNLSLEDIDFLSHYYSKDYQFIETHLAGELK